MKRLSHFESSEDGKMGPTQDKSPCAVTPAITVSPPAGGPREEPFPWHRASAEAGLGPIAELAGGARSRRSLSPADAADVRAPRGAAKPPGPAARNAADCSGGESEEEKEEGDHGSELDKLKLMATRLRLSTRRPSYVEWCDNLPRLGELNSAPGGDDWTSFAARRDALDEKIQWVRKELIQMKAQDHRLAVQLMRLRSEIQRLRLVESCRAHRALIDTATEGALAERHCLPPRPGALLCDPPFLGGSAPLLALEKPLKDVGVTRLNLFARRFSLC